MHSQVAHSDSPGLWPALPYEEWQDTCSTLHMWTQVVGKIALAHAPPLNHSWGIALHLTPRGLTTAVLAHGPRSFTIQFDFIDHQLAIETSDGVRQVLPLAPQSVAAFYAAVMRKLEDMGLPVRIWSTPVEISAPIPFERDTVHQSYDPEYANRFWRLLVQVHRVFTDCRCSFVGKSSPAHFFWGSFDLAVSRFSGRPAPPRDGPAFMREAYSHEVISHGFWPGTASVIDAAFYAYAVPEPDGMKAAVVEPTGAFYHPDLNEFVLPYEVVRQSPSPEAALAAFVNSTYDRAASLAGWDRAALERPVPRPL
jgi:hypothetical protein